jgi:ComF family protein
MKFFLDACKDLVFPAHCLECDRRLPLKRPPLFCDDCLSDISFIGSPYCTCCGLPFQSGHGQHHCSQCHVKPYSFDLARAAVLYQEPVSSLISSLKFNGQLTGLPTLAALAESSTGFSDLSEPEIILPVPLHDRRLRERGFNQAAVLAHAIFKKRRKKITTAILVRNRATIPQTGLSGRLRRKNLFGAFSIKQPKMVQGKRILLIDDVFTTGSTVNECARTLRKHGAEQVEVFTLCKAI